MVTVASEPVAAPRFAAPRPRELEQPRTNNLVDRIAKFIERFVFIREKPIYRLLALWVIQTHFYKDFEYMGYIFAYSPEAQSGKSRLLEVLQLLVANPTDIQVSPTEAVLFRTADEMTQLLDEVDTWQNREVLRAVLNAGNHRGGTVQRNRQDKDGDWITVKFPVYGPRALAGIGLGILHGTTRDRTFIIPMVRQTQEERREKFRSRKVKPEADQLRAEIKSWGIENREHIIALYDTTLPYLEHLQDRTGDVTEPLAAILEVACPENRLEFLEAISLTRKDGQEFVFDHKILQELARLAETENPLVGMASELANRLPFNPPVTEYQVAATLHRYGFENRSVRVGESIRRRYELPGEQLREVCARFCSHLAPET